MTAEAWTKCWSDLNYYGLKVTGGMTHQAAKESLTELFYHYRERGPGHDLWKRMDRKLNEDETSFVAFSYIELFAWICGQLLVRDHADQNRAHI